MAKKSALRSAVKKTNAKSAAKRKTQKTKQARDPRLPLTGIRVVELTNVVRGPPGGMIRGDLGAGGIKVEPRGGDKTRKLIGWGAGFFSFFNRNKKSVTADLADPKDRARIERLIAS